MTSPHRCPLCYGTGRVSTISSASTDMATLCHGCQGTGIAWTPQLEIRPPGERDVVWEVTR